MDVGGDVLARGDEPGLASPLCDAVMLAGARHASDRLECVLAVLGPGCDGELTQAEVLGRVAALARAGAWLGTWSVTPEGADEIHDAALAVRTEASLQAARCARGEVGKAPIRGGRRSVQLGPVGALIFALDPALAGADELPLARAVAGSRSLEEARDALAALGVQHRARLRAFARGFAAWVNRRIGAIEQLHSPRREETGGGSPRGMAAAARDARRLCFLGARSRNYRDLARALSGMGRGVN